MTPGPVGATTYTLADALLELSTAGLCQWTEDMVTVTIRLADRAAHLLTTPTDRVASHAASHLDRLRDLADELPTLIDRLEQAATGDGEATTNRAA